MGKTAVAHELARRRGLSILSADSMLVYRGMDIGTAKPSLAERQAHRYGGVDVVDPDQDFSVADYLGAARNALSGQDACIVAGGTGLYVKCLLLGLDEVPPPDPALRERAATMSVAELQDELRKKAPELLEALSDRQNPRRLVRALEKAGAGGSPSATWGEHAGTVVGLRMAPVALARRIDGRVTAMYRNGLLEEARGLRERWALSKTARQAIGYAEAWDVLDGKLTGTQGMERTAARTRQLAKRQMTWFKNQARVAWIDVDPNADTARTADMVESLWNHYGPNNLRI